jgi:hypothetical protein
METIGKIIVFVLLLVLTVFSLLYFEKEEPKPKPKLKTPKKAKARTNVVTTIDYTKDDMILHESEEEEEEEEEEIYPNLEDTLQTTARRAYTNDDLDRLTLMTSDDMIYCLKKNDTCEKMPAGDCAKNKHIETYLTQEDCDSALNKKLGRLDSVWCIKGGKCKKYDNDEIGFGLKKEDTECNGNYKTEEECKYASGES